MKALWLTKAVDLVSFRYTRGWKTAQRIVNHFWCVVSKFCSWSSKILDYYPVGLWTLFSCLCSKTQATRHLHISLLTVYSAFLCKEIIGGVVNWYFEVHSAPILSSIYSNSPFSFTCAALRVMKMQCKQNPGQIGERNLANQWTTAIIPVLWTAWSRRYCLFCGSLLQVWPVGLPDHLNQSSS